MIIKVNCQCLINSHSSAHPWLLQPIPLFLARFFTSKEFWEHFIFTCLCQVCLRCSAQVGKNTPSLLKLVPEYSVKKMKDRTSLVVQWLRIRLPIQGTQVRSLVQEDPTCRGATNLCVTTTKPVLQSPRATTTEAHVPRARALQQREATAMRSPRTTTKSSPCSPQLEKAHAQ